MVRYDIRGTGRSARPTTDFAHYEDLHALLEFLEIKRAVICGTSFGGAIALDFALDYPEMPGSSGAGLSSDTDHGIEAVRALSAGARNEGIDGAIELVTGMPSFISPKNAAAKRRIRQIYFDNRGRLPFARSTAQWLSPHATPLPLTSSGEAPWS